MNTKKFLLSLLAVFVLLEVTNYIIHGMILSSTYAGDELKGVFRTDAEMSGMMWIMYVMDLIWSYFFVFLFIKGFENKGIMEGLRFGFYMGIFVFLVSSFGMYVMMPIAFSLSLAWFIYGMIQSLLMGLTVALIYKPKEIAAAQPAAV